MASEIIKVYQEHLPSLRFIGKRYTNADRKGSFAHKWGEWFEKGWFSILEGLGTCEDIENGYLGLMRFQETGDGFEYWIGMFLPAGTEIPQGFDGFDLQESQAAVCWIRGKEEDGLYQMHSACVSKFQKAGLGNFQKDKEGRFCFFERYQCPRFLQPDEHGNVILDYGVYLESV